MVNGIFKIVIGVAFWFLRVIDTINFTNADIFQYFADRNEAELVNGIFYQQIGDELIARTVYTYSIFPKIIAILFILWGIYTIVKEMKK